MHNTYSFDFSVTIGAQTIFNGLRINPTAPVSFQKFSLQTQICRHLLPQCCEMAGFNHQHQITLLQQIHQRRFPCASTRCRIDHHWAGGFENTFHTVQTLLANRGELRPPVIYRRIIHRPQHPIRHIGRAGNLQKMTPSGMRCRHKKNSPIANITSKTRVIL